LSQLFGDIVRLINHKLLIEHLEHLSAFEIASRHDEKICRRRKRGLESARQWAETLDEACDEADRSGTMGRRTGSEPNEAVDGYQKDVETNIKILGCEGFGFVHSSSIAALR
jgi:hypothetical protein